MILGQFAGGPAVRTDYNQTDPSKADYLVGRENIAPKTHVDDKNNPHGVTAAQAGARPNTWLPTIAEIGAAPSGYGLGEGAAYPSNVGLTNANIARSGFYRWDSDGQSAGFPFVYGTMMVNARTKDANSFQFAMSHADAYEGTMAARLYSKNKEYAWEYINPPMALGVEYRTTERWNGKPVYVKLVNFGTMPNNTQKSITVASTGVTQMVYAEGIARHSGGSTHVPLGDHSAVAIVTEINSSQIYLTLQASTDFSAWSAIVLLKYVK